MHEREVLARPALRETEGEAQTALDAVAGVDRALGGDLLRRPLAEEAALACIGPLGVLAHHGHVEPPAGEWAHVDVQVELEAQA